MESLRMYTRRIMEEIIPGFWDLLEETILLKYYHRYFILEELISLLEETDI